MYVLTTVKPSLKILLGGFSILAIAVTLWFGSFVRITVNTSTASSGKRPPQVSKQPDLTELKIND
ncbi:MAG: hypothetical protein HC903_11910 [Methylacidiphilales bacterium]|nr:hypothetical protein [Candidatus Methylacidiphilales bacterium]